MRDDYGGVDGLNNAQSVTISPSGDHIYVVGNGENAVSTFDLNSSSGLLTQTDVIKQGDGSLNCLDGALEVIISSDGNHAYVTGYIDDAVSWYERNATTGALTYRGMLKDGAGGVDGLNEAVA